VIMTTMLGDDARKTMLRQIGNVNFAAISGGRVSRLPDGVELPVGNGYRVRVRLDEANDTYTVERVFVRSGKVTLKGVRTNVYCDELGETAYRASCFRSYDEKEW
jgi:hypothetical protein